MSQNLKKPFFVHLVLFALFCGVVLLVTSGKADEAKAPAGVEAAFGDTMTQTEGEVAREEGAVPLPKKSWLATYNPTLGMCNASIFTTIAGGAMVAFFIAVCWGKLVEAVGPLGGVIGGGVIVGTFWILNHKLPGVGINPGCVPHPDGFGSHQFGLIVQAFHSTGPWIDMSLAVCVGLFVCTFLERLKAKQKNPALPGAGGLLAEATPRVIFVVIGGIIGGIIVGMIGFTGATI